MLSLVIDSMNFARTAFILIDIWFKTKMYNIALLYSLDPPAAALLAADVLQWINA